MALPKHFLPKDTTRARSKKQESRIAKDLLGRTTLNSGATFGENDVITDFCEIEAKTTRKDSYTLKIKEFDKLLTKTKVGKMPIFTIEFEEQKKDVVIMDYHDFLYLINTANS